MRFRDWFNPSQIHGIVFYGKTTDDCGVPTYLRVLAILWAPWLLMGVALTVIVTLAYPWLILGRLLS